MSGSTQTQIIEVENLLRSFGAPPVFANDNIAPLARRLRSRSVLAACFALLVFAPGCAAATVFLMRADGTVPPVVTPDSNPPFVAKSDRLPMEQWSIEAVTNLGSAEEARIVTASAAADPAFLSPILIRGSLEDGTLTSFDEPAAAAEPAIAPPAKLRPRREARRARPSKLVAEVTPPASEPPSFFERLFGPRTN